jgi:hypothetical protein
MHLFFMVRGVIHQLDLFEMFMQTQMFTFPRYNLTICECGQQKAEHDEEKCKFKGFQRKKEVILVQGGLRRTPFGYEYIFPEEHLAEVLTMLDIQAKDNRWKIGNLKSWLLRKALGKGDNGDKVTPIPNYTPVITNRYIEKRGIAIYPIGIKKDARSEVKEWGYEQEMI